MELAFKNYSIRSGCGYIHTDTYTIWLLPLDALNWRFKNCHKPIKRPFFFFCFRQRLGGALSFTSWVCHKSNATDRGGYKFRAGDWLSYQEAVKQSTKMLRMTSISCNCVNCIPKMRNLVGLTMDQLKMSNKAYKCTVWIALNGYINKDCALFAGILGKIQSPILTAHIPYLEKPSLIIQFSTYSNLTWAMRFIKQNYTQHGFFAEEIC